MSNYSRFGLIPLPLSMKEKAVNGEFLIDPNTGHLYLKDNNGKVFSKTLELEERINQIEIIRMHSLDNVTFDGSQFSIMTNSTDFTIESPISAVINTDLIRFDKVPFYASPFCKYQMEITFEPNNKEIIGNMYLDPLDSSAVLEKMSGKLTHGTDTENECTRLFDFTMYKSQFDKEGKAIFSIENAEGIKIKHVRLQKLPINNGAVNSLVIDASDIKLTGQTIYETIINNGTTTNNKIYTFKVPVGGIEIDMTKYSLMVGLYSVNITIIDTEENNDTLTMTTISNDGTETQLSYELDTSLLPNLKEKYNAEDNTLNANKIKVGTMGVLVPMAGLSKIKLKPATKDMYIYSLSFNYIDTALYDHRTI